MQRCAFPDRDSILKTRNISGLLSAPFLWMHVEGWRAGFLPGFPCHLCQIPYCPKARGCGLTDHGRTDRQRKDLKGWNGRGENVRLLLTAALPYELQALLPMGQNESFCMVFIKCLEKIWQHWENKPWEWFAVVCCLSMWRSDSAEEPTNSVCDLSKSWETGRHKGGGENTIILMLCEHCRGSESLKCETSSTGKDKQCLQKSACGICFSC